MGFEGWIQADSSKTTQLPTLQYLESALKPANPERTSADQLLLVLPGNEGLEFGYQEDDSGLIEFINIDKPSTSPTLWKALYRLLASFDMFMYWPGERLIAVMARPDVPLPDDMEAERVIVNSAMALQSLVEES